MSIRKRKWKTRNGFEREVTVEDYTDRGKRIVRTLAPIPSGTNNFAAVRAAADWFTLAPKYRTKERLLKMVAEAR